MATLDRRPAYTENDNDGSQVLNEEVKDFSSDDEEEKDTQEDSSPSDKPSEEDESIEDDTSEKTVDSDNTDNSSKKESSEDKQLEALRKEREKLLEDISSLRGERRKAREEKKEEPLILEKDDDLSDVAESDVQLIERVMKAKGYVKKEELHSMTYKEKLDVEQNAWLKDHPQYLPENDSDDKNWNNLKATIEAYFKAPDKPSDIKKIMDLAHSMLFPSERSLQVKNKASIDASKEKINSSSKGSIGGGQKSSPRSQKSNIDTSYLIGFTEEEIKEIIS